MTAHPTDHLTRPEGRIAFDDRGAGPLVVCIPGVGDTRDEYRAIAPLLLAAGYRVVTVDLRGHGDSDVTFTGWERADVGGDIVALLEHLGASEAHLVGCSLGAGAAVWAATEAPERIASLTLIGPFVRDDGDELGARLQRGLLGLLLRGPWGPSAWAWWHGRIHGTSRPDDLAAHQGRLRTMLRDPQRLAATRRLAMSGCEEIEARLPDVRARTLVVMGTSDPDFPDPQREAGWIAEQLDGEVLMVADGGHYPHVEQPDAVAPPLLGLLRDASAAAS